jgi:hypothetical protein
MINNEFEEYIRLYNKMKKQLIRAYYSFNEKGYGDFKALPCNNKFETVPIDLDYFEVRANGYKLYISNLTRHEIIVPLQILDGDNIEENVKLYIEEEILKNV